MEANEKQKKVIDLIINVVDCAKYNDIGSKRIESKLRSKLEQELINGVNGLTLRDVQGYSNLVGRILYNLRNV